MSLDISLKALKGIAPGIFLEKELQKRKIPKGHLALAIGEYPQTLSAIITGKRSMNTSLALKIERELGMEEGLFMILQTFYEIKEIKQKEAGNEHPDLSKFRKSLFWDTRLENINWNLHKKSVIKRIFERGNEREKQEAIRFYGKKSIETVIGSLTR